MVQQEKRLTKKQKRILRQQGILQESEQKPLFKIDEIQPLTENQNKAFDSFYNGQNLLLTGTAGTGKTFLSLYLAMDEILSPRSDFKKAIIVRSVVPTRDMGFLPGNNKEKMAVYEAPYTSIFSELFNRGDAYQILKQKNLVDFMSTSFVRGITLSDCIIIVDEIQNMNASELHSIFTRIGKRCRVIFCGDIKQNDLNRTREQSGFNDFFKIINRMKQFSSIEFTKEDICRSQLVKEYIIIREQMEEKGIITAL
jgi:phosphate starvation-inducible protein PhoH